MDCHVFRRLCDSLLPLLTGCRLEKIHAHANDVFLLTLYGHGRKHFLFLKFGHRDPFLFLAHHKVPVGSAPPAAVMRLRKYLAEKRIVSGIADWPGRRLFLRFSDETDLWLAIDLRSGLSLLFAAPEIPEPPVWPEAARWQDLCSGTGWRNWPVMTPALRRTLLLLPAEEQAALLMDLEYGGGDLFVYEAEDGGRSISAWPLPEGIRGQRSELVVEDPLKACALTGEKQVLENLAARARSQATKPFVAEANRLRRLLNKLDGERDRLSEMYACREKALLLQANLFALPANTKTDRLILPPTGGTSGGEAPNAPREIVLDPRLTIVENMQALFHKARRGKRGLDMLQDRLAAVKTELIRAEQAIVNAEAAGTGPARNQAASVADARRKQPLLPKNVQAFRSSDGFLLLRGRDAKGNLALLKLASPYDLWMHTGGGPGAHLLVRRSHANQDIPETTLTEAATLTALKSWQKDQTSVEVITALARYVHPIRGAKPGTVRIDRFEPSIEVRPDPDVEKRLGGTGTELPTATGKQVQNRSIDAGLA